MMTTKTRPYRILVIDDIIDIHKDFQKILTDSGNPISQNLNELNKTLFGSSIETKRSQTFELDAVFQGKEGVQLVRKALSEQNPYAVAFVDVLMPPGMDGIQTIEEIWKVDPDIQIVICTAHSKYTWDDLRNRFGETDRLFVLKKPFDQLETLNLAHSLAKRWSINKSIKEKMQHLSEEKSQTSTPLPGGSKLKEAIDMLDKLNANLKNKTL